MFALPLLGHIRPVAFHPYTSRVLDRIFEVECNKPDLMACYRQFEDELLNTFKRAGIKCAPDNKIVFECSDGQKIICYGFYDWRFSIGFSYHDENEHWYDQRYFKRSKR